MQGKQENACIFSISSVVSIRVKERTTFRTFMLVFVSNGEFFSLNTQERTCAKYENFHHYDGNFFWFELKEVMTKMRKKNELTNIHHVATDSKRVNSKNHKKQVFNSETHILNKPFVPKKKKTLEIYMKFQNLAPLNTYTLYIYFFFLRSSQSINLAN